MVNITNDTNKLVKARKVARLLGALLIFGGGVLLVMGLATLALQQVVNGVVLIAGAVILLAFSKMIEKKIPTVGGV